MKETKFPIFKPGSPSTSRVTKNITDKKWLHDNSSNLVVTKLNASVTNQDLIDIFSPHGTVVMSKLSYTLSKDNLGIISATSNSYGYVRLESPEEAETAIKELHGSDVGGSNIVIEKFNKEKKADKSINNIYVKEFPTTWTDEDLGNLFKKYGELGSVKVMFDDEGKSKGFGFVCF